MYDKLTALGFQDVTEENCSSDGRMLDYAMIKRDSTMGRAIGL
jgi:hypothetical protein